MYDLSVSATYKRMMKEPWYSSLGMDRRAELAIDISVLAQSEPQLEKYVQLAKGYIAEEFSDAV